MNRRELKSSIKLKPRRLTPESVRQIRRMVADGISVYRVIKLSGVSRGAIRGVLEGRTWSQVV